MSTFHVTTKPNCTVGICSPYYRAPSFVAHIETDAGTKFNQTFGTVDAAYHYCLEKGATHKPPAPVSNFHRNALARVQFELA